MISNLIFLLFSVSALAQPKLKVVTSTPDLAEVVREIGGDQVEVTSLLSGTEDPHYIDALPNFIRQVADADAVCVVGLDLEIGWMPKILSRSGNVKVQPGGPGYCDFGNKIKALDIPKGPIDRSMGDVHPLGNPHYNLSPSALADAAVAPYEMLARLRPTEQKKFSERLAALQKRLRELQAKINVKLAPYRAALKLIEYHREFTYFFNAYNLASIGSIEEKPGVPPSAAHLAEVAQRMKSEKVRLAIGALQTPEKQLVRLQELSGVPFKRLPEMVQREDSQLNTIEKLQNYLSDELLKAK